ncbi:DMT family transporter [Paracoccus endophyticus]|uniref:DMT family transporter n=1 Tax=Paracoccus endophyticus TaxID=2233774 RepID=UPI001F0CBB15|nr:DMT family transporter [Paracoccus endophyticus]
MPTRPLPATQPAPSLSRGRATRAAPAESSGAENLRGAGLMMLSMAAFLCNDATMKYVTQTLSLAETVTLRGVMVTAILWLMARREGGVDWWPAARRDRRLLALRCAAEISSTLLYLMALQHLALGDISSILQSLPLLLMLAAALVFRERLGWRRLTAVAVGLAGVLIILRPGTSAFTVWSLVALASVLLIVVREMATRGFSPAMRSGTIAFYAALIVTLGAPLMPAETGWRWPTAAETAALGLSVTFLTVGYLTAVAAMRVGDVGFVSPFRYTSLLWAIVLGMVVFGEWPDRWTWIGAALVVGAGIYSILREARLRAQRP